MAQNKNPFSGPAPLLLLAALVIGALAGGLDHYFQLQARQQAVSQSHTLARDLAASLGGLVSGDRQRLARLADSPRAADALAGGALVSEDLPNQDQGEGGSRLILVPTANALDPDLSYVMQDLLRQLAEPGSTALSSRGGAQPALLLARAAPGGALILEHPLNAWLAGADRRLPTGASLTLEQDGLTVAKLGPGQPADDGARARAASKPLALTVTVPPAAALWQTLLLPVGGTVALMLLAAGLVLTVLHRRRAANAAKAPPARGTPKPPPAPAAPSKPVATPVAAPPPPSGPELPAHLFLGDRLGGPGLDRESLHQLGQTIGSEAGDGGEHDLFLAREPHAPEPLYEALAEGLLASGRQVLDLGVASRPLLYYATEVLETRAGLYLAGDADGHPTLEVRLDGDTLTDERLTALGQRLREGRLHRGQGQREPRQPGPRYLRDLGDDIVLARPMKVVVDSADGNAAALLEELGCTVTPAGQTPLSRAVPEAGAEVGLGLSADGTRLTVVAADGATVPAERVLMLLARDLLGRNPGSDVLFDVECSPALATPVRELGGRPVIAPAGATALKARLRESGAPLAGDGEGHICFADRWFGFDDGLYAAARLLEILSLQSGDGARAFADP